MNSDFLNCASRAIALLVFLLITSTDLYAACKRWSEHNETNVDDLKVGEIEIRAGDIFDVDEKNERLFIHQAANRLHIKTRSHVVSALASVEQHEPFQKAKLEDIERRLRSVKFIRDAVAEPTSVCDDKVNIRITTIDNWTLTPSISFGTAGGESKFGFDIKESNLFGTGTELRLGLDRKNGEDIYGFGYSDPVFFSRNQSFSMGYSSSDSNESTGFLFTRGNRIKSDGWRWRVSYDATNELVKQGELEFDRQINLKELEALYPMTETVSLGVSVSESSDSIVPSSPGLNHDPTFERSSIGINALLEIDLRSYTEIKNYKSVDQTEDLGIGSSIRLSAGVARQRNGTGSGLGLSVGYNYGAHIGQGVFTGGMGISRVDDGQHAVANLTSHIEWIAPLGTSSRFRLRGDAESISGYSFADHLDVGGENGLKGYPNRYQTGPNRLLFVAEYRQDLPYRIWDLGRLGMTFFAESGRAWGDRGEQPWLHNFGAGLIFSPSRSSSTNLVRMELAAPMTDNEELAPVQLFIGAESRF